MSSRPVIVQSSLFDDDEVLRSIQYITDNILVTALPRRQQQGQLFFSNDDDDDDENEESSLQQRRRQEQRHDDDLFFVRRLQHLDSFLQQQQSVLGGGGGGGGTAQFVLVNLATEPADPALLQVMNHQVVHLPWQATGAPASELPTLECLLRICYAVTALLSWTPAPAGTGGGGVRVIVACENGQTRTGLAVAALLRYMDHVPCARDGFLHFVVRTILAQQQQQQSLAVAAATSPMAIYDGLPASVKTLLRNWDQTMEWKAWLQPKPLWLRAITIQGIPVEDQPCVDLYDATGRHVYSSHAWLWEEQSGENDHDDDDKDKVEPEVEDKCRDISVEQGEDPSLSPSQMSGLTGGSSAHHHHHHQLLRHPESPKSQKQQVQRHKQAATASPWVDDEGFYKVNQWVAGDFCILCRFGGPHAMAENVIGPATADTTKLLFRYASSTTVLSGGILECPMSQVDIMERYQPFLDPHDFLLTLVWESSWEKHATSSCTRVDWAPPPLVFGHEALSEGCAILSEFHVLQPVPESLQIPMGCAPNIWMLLWQLSAGDEGLTRERMQILVRRFEAEDALRARGLTSSRKGHATTDADPKHAQSILNILDSIDVDDVLDETSSPADSSNKEAATNKDVLVEAGESPDNVQSIDVSSTSQDESRHESSRQNLDGSLQWRSAILQASAGDIPVALGLRGHAFDWIHTVQHAESLPPPTEQPRLPMLPLRQAERLPALAPLDDPSNAAAVELYLKLAHAGVTLEDVQELAAVEMDVMPVREESTERESKPKVAGVEQGNPNEASYHEEEKKAEFKDESLPVQKDSESSKREEEVVESERTEKEDKKEEREVAPGDKPAMRKDARFEKYWKMKSVGLPEGAIKQAMQKDGVDVSIWELDWEKNYEEQTDSGTGESDGAKVPMKRDVRFEKYWKMKSIGLPEGAIKQAMQKDNVDTSVWELDWENNYEEQTDVGGGDCGKCDTEMVPMKKDPRFEKYWKMKSVGLPEGAIQNAMTRDSVDSSVLQLDWEKSYEEQTSSPTTKSSGPPMKQDPRFEKYWKMKSVGLPDGAILNAMARDNVDGAVLNLDWEKNYEEQMSPSGGTVNGPPMKEDPRFEKYWKMKNVGLPDGAILNAMARDNVDSSVLGLDWNKNYEVQTGAGGSDAQAGPSMKDDPKFKKYWKMKSVGLPDGAIRNAMTKDGLDPSLLDLDWERSLASQQGAQPAADTGPPLKDDPEFTKYFRMLSMGLPPGAVKNAMSRDGKDPGVIDLDPNRTLTSQIKGPSQGAQRRGSIVPKKRVRRKKIFWKPLDPDQIKENSLWSLVKGKVSMSHLNYDAKEFEDLFTESADPADKKKKKKAKQSAKSAKKAVQVIDGKRSMNGGIILLRLKMEYEKIAELVDDMEQGRLDATQMMALKENLPSVEEIAGLEAYMGKCKTEEETAKAYADLSECEKYMWTMRRVEDAKGKFDCMLFKAQFRTRVDELVASMKVVEKACDEVKTSESLHKVLAMILTLVNTINTGDGHGQGVAQGFNLDALLKLNEAKAFDKKTSVLQYLVKLVRHNDDSLLNFHKELKHVSEAQNLMMDMLGTDITKLSEDLAAIRGPVTKAAESAEATGERKVTLEELKEQKTLVRRNGAVLQFNKVDHLTGRTPMERFFLRATNDVSALVGMSEEIKAKYKSVLDFFGEDSQMPSNEFFGTMYRFIQEFMVSEKQVEKEERARQKERRRSEAKAKAAADKAKSRGIASPPDTTPVGLAQSSQTSFGSTINQSSPTPEGEMPSTTHTLTSMLAARQNAEGAKKLEAKHVSSKAHPLAAMLAERQQPETDKAEPGATLEESRRPSLNSHPLAAMLASCHKPETTNTDAEKSETNEVSSSSHPLAAMLASRHEPETTNTHAEKSETAAHQLAAMIASRQQPETTNDRTEKIQTAELSSTARPLTSILAASKGPTTDSSDAEEATITTRPLAERLAARNGSVEKPNEVTEVATLPTEPETNPTAHPLAVMLAARSKGLETANKAGEVATSTPSDFVSAKAKDSPVSEADDETSQSTVEEAPALVAKEKALSDEVSKEHSGGLIGGADLQFLVKSDSLVDAPLEIESEVATMDNEVPRDNTKAWLAAVIEATGRESRRTAQPKLAARSRSDESAPWVSRRESMSMD